MPVGQHRDRQPGRGSEAEDRAQVGDGRHRGAEVGGDGGQREHHHVAVEADEEGRDPREGEDGPAGPRYSSWSRLRSHGPGPRKPQVAPKRTLMTPSSEGGPGSSQKASATGTPTTAAARTSAPDQPPGR